MIQLFYLTPGDKDPYYDITVTLSVVEANIAIVTASAPALRPLFRSLLPGLFGGSSARYGADKQYNYQGGTSPYFSGVGGSMAAGAGRTANGTHIGTGSRHDPTEASVARHSSIRLKNMRGNKNGHTECRSVSPSGSEEEIMTYNGIMRTTDVQVRVQFAGDNGTLVGADTDQSSRASSDVKAGAKAHGEKGVL